MKMDKITYIRYLILFNFLTVAACIMACQHYDMHDYIVSNVTDIFMPAATSFNDQDYYEMRIGRLFNYQKLTLKEKKSTLKTIRMYDGDNFQCMRFLCWVIEDEPAIRVELLNQWLSIHKEHGDLPAINAIFPLIKEIVDSDTDEHRNNRIQEFKNTYHSICEKKWWSHSNIKYIPDLTNGTETRIIQPLIDPKEPLSLTIFSSDLNKKNESIEECAHLNFIVSRNADGAVVDGYMKSTTIYDAMMRLGMSMRNKKW